MLSGNELQWQINFEIIFIVLATRTADYDRNKKGRNWWSSDRPQGLNGGKKKCVTNRSVGLVGSKYIILINFQYSAEVHFALEIRVNGDHFIQFVQIELGRHAPSWATTVGANRAQIRVIVEDGLHVVACTESDQVGIVGWRRNRNWSSATHVGMAQLVSETLFFF